MGRACRSGSRSLTIPWGVAVATMDMSRTYREVVELGLPRAKIVADRFHVEQHGWAGFSTRCDCASTQAGAERRGELYELRYVLLTDQAKWTDEERRRLRRVFETQAELYTAWKLRERFRHWYETEDRVTAERLLVQWENEVRQGGIAEFIQLSQGANAMLVEWREPILNYFDTKLTNGFVEGKNNRTKAIQRQAYGYSNPANLRMRVLMPKTA